MAAGRRSQSSTALTRWTGETAPLNCCQSLGRMPPVTDFQGPLAMVPPQATSEPGQNMVAVRMPLFSAVTQIGSASSHQ